MSKKLIEQLIFRILHILRKYARGGHFQIPTLSFLENRLSQKIQGKSLTVESQISAKIRRMTIFI